MCVCSTAKKQKTLERILSYFSSCLPDRGVLGSELLGDPLDVDVCDGVEAPSLESTDEAFTPKSLKSPPNPEPDPK